MARIEIKVPNWLDRICAWPVVWYRKQRYGDPFRRIPLGEGKFTLVSPEDFYWLNNFQWCAQHSDQNIYAVRFILKPNKRPKIVSLHKEIMKSPNGLLVDHKNCHGIDNRRSNLRFATASENMCNRRKTSSKTSSRFIGVCFDKWTGRWSAHVGVNGKTRWLGRFDSEIDAAKARDKAARIYHKEFARLNFPEEAPVS
jgi:hypothetical protein